VKKFSVLILFILLVTACTPFDLVASASNGGNSGSNSSNNNTAPTIAALLTNQPEFHPTATMFQPQINYNPTTPPLPTTPPIAPTSTKTPPTSATAPVVTTSLSLTLVDDGNAPGEADVFWNASGSFPAGFKILWSATNNNPSFPGDNNQLVSDPGARSTTVQATAGKNFYFRVCRFINGGCDNYSNVYSFKLASEAVPTTAPADGITIKKVEEISTGQAKVTWAVTGIFPKGFKVVWSDSTSTPTYPGDSAVFAGSDARTATITGNPGTKYYIRVCKYNGSGCDFYSGKYTFTFSGAPESTEAVSIAITGMSDKVIGAAYIEWSAAGSFPSGFKIAWSSSNPNPVYPPDAGGLWTYISDGGARSAVVEGTPGTTYYFRVCQYLGGSCGVYSDSYSFTFESEPVPTEDTSTITLISVGASADPTIASATWEGSGSFPEGFKIVWSSTSDAPSYPDNMDGYTYISNPSATSGETSALVSGTTYHVRVCKYETVTAFINNLGIFLFNTLHNTSTATCTRYSNTLDYTVP
jgi:hypothetical protein